MSTRTDERYYLFVLGVLALSMLALHRFRHSRTGRSMLMVGTDREAAAASGVSPWTYRVLAFTIAGLFAGIAGAISLPLYYNTPGSLQYVSVNSIFYLAIPILAGFDSLTTLVAVAVAFTIAPQILIDWQLNVYLLGGLGFAVGILLGPRGLGGCLADLVERLSGANPARPTIDSL